MLGPCRDAKPYETLPNQTQKSYASSVSSFFLNRLANCEALSRLLWHELLNPIYCKPAEAALSSQTHRNNYWGSSPTSPLIIPPVLSHNAIAISSKFLLSSTFSSASAKGQNFHIHLHFPISIIKSNTQCSTLLIRILGKSFCV